MGADLLEDHWCTSPGGQAKKGVVGKGHGSHLKCFRVKSTKECLGKLGFVPFFGVYPPDGCVYNITKTNGNIYGEPQK